MAPASSESVMPPSAASSSSSSSSFTFQPPKATGPMTLPEMLESAEYNAGRALINSGDYDAAIEHFNNLLRKT